MNSLVEQVRLGDFVVIRFYLKGFVRIFEGICLIRKSGLLLLRGYLFGCAVELLLRYKVVCIVSVFVFNYRHLFVSIRRARLYFLRKKVLTV